ncbi:MAG: hypothetical protein LUE29_09695 [Lachnospiraceae bacterium]|nr:hypothetical protein [Lachnospiraceae bacterium]
MSDIDERLKMTVMTWAREVNEVIFKAKEYTDSVSVQLAASINNILTKEEKQ